MARVVLQQKPSTVERTIKFFSSNGCLSYLFFAAGIILVYFCLSIGLTFYQRWFLQKFHYPLLVVMCHLLIKFMVALICRTLWQCWSRSQKLRISWSNTVTKIAPMGFAGGLDIAFSNWGLGLVVVSLYTMTKSTSIIFILIFAIIFKLERKSWSLFLIVAMISGGLAMFTYKSVQFDLLGFVLVLFASFSSGLRWTLAQFLMQRSELGLNNPIDMIYHVQPWMFLSVLPFVLVFEARGIVESYSTVSLDTMGPSALDVSLLILCGALIALAMELTEFLVVSTMSSLTLSVACIFKEVCTVTLAVWINGDQMSKINALGLLLCLGGIVCHVVHKVLSSGSSQHKPLILDDAAAQFLPEGGSSSSGEEEDDLRDDSSTEILFSVLNSRER